MKATGAVRELWVGILLAVAFVVFFVLLISVGEQHNLLSPKNTYHTRFKQTQGLTVGAPVWLEGVPVGSVTEISFPEEIDDFSIEVAFQVDRALAPRIRQDTTAILVSQGLIGEVLLGLERGHPTSPPAEPGAFLAAREIGTLEEFKSQGQMIAENIVSISHDIRSILDRLEQGEGLLARLLTDDEFAKQFLDRIGRTNVAVNELVEGLNRGDSFLGRLLTTEDPLGAEAADSLLASIKSVDSIIGRMERGEGTLGRLMTSDEEFDHLVTSLSEMSHSVRNFTKELEEGEGLLSQLIRDEEMGEEVVANLRTASANLASISGRLERGEGTLGAFLNDPALYEALRDLVGGIEKSRVLRWWLRRKVKKGAEAELEEVILEPVEEAP